MAEPTPPAEQFAAPATRNLRRRILAIVGAVAFVVLALVAIQTWQVLDAIKTIQEEVVVELPTRDPSIELGGAVNSGDKPPAITFGSPPAITFDPTQPAVTPTIGRGSTWRNIIPPAAQATTPVPTVRSLPTGVPRTVSHKTGAFVPGAVAPPLLTAIASTATAAVAGGGSLAATPTPSPTTRSLGASTPRPTTTPVPTATRPATATATPRPSSTPTATPSPSATRTATRLPTPSATATPSPTATTLPSPTAAPSATPAPSATASASDTPAPTATAVASDTPAPTATAASDNGGGSTLDVARDIVSQAMESGDPGTSAIWGGRTELNILVLGIDRRPDGSYVNADVIMIFRIDLIDREVHVVSLPRDLLVQVPGFGWWKLNGAFEIGEDQNPGDPAAGPSKMRDTIEYNFAVPIDGYVFVDFNGFRQIIDAAGGVTVDVPYDIYDPRYPVDDQTTEEIFFPAGPTTMDGTTALKYVRTRNADGDDARRQRQMQVLLALLDQGKSIGSIARADELILSLVGSAQTSFTLEEQLTLARLALLIDRGTIRMYSVAPPLVQGGTTDGGIWVYVGDPQQLALFVQGALAGNFDDATPTPIPGAAPPADSSGSGGGSSAPAATDTPVPTDTPLEPTAPPVDATTDPGAQPTVGSSDPPPTSSP